MTGYRRADDGAEMVEVRPGSWVRRDVALALGLAVPTVSATGRAASVAPAADPQPGSAAPPPLQPSHEDLVSAVPKPTDIARRSLDDDGMARRAQILISDTVTGPGLEATPAPAAAPTRAAKARPAKRSVSAILAEAARNQRARKVRA